MADQKFLSTELGPNIWPDFVESFRKAELEHNFIAMYDLREEADKEHRQAAEARIIDALDDPQMIEQPIAIPTLTMTFKTDIIPIMTSFREEVLTAMSIPTTQDDGLTDEMIAALRSRGIAYSRPDTAPEDMDIIESPLMIAHEPFEIPGTPYKAFCGPLTRNGYWWMLKDARGQLHDGVARSARNARKEAIKFVKENSPRRNPLKKR